MQKKNAISFSYTYIKNYHLIYFKYMFSPIFVYYLYTNCMWLFRVVSLVRSVAGQGFIRNLFEEIDVASTPG